LASKIPLGALGAILIVVAYNMSELEHFKSILKSGHTHDKLVLIATYILTVCVDLTFAVQIGVLLSALLFLKHMSEKTTLTSPDSDDEIAVFELVGPLFFGASDILNRALDARQEAPKQFIVDLRHVPLVDATGLHAL